MRHDMAFGAQPAGDDWRFRLWAPSAPSVTLVLGGEEVAMSAAASGWYEAIRPAAPGDEYRFAVGDLKVPDPASRCQADDVHGPSVLVDADLYEWRHPEWTGRPWEETVAVELHVGTATPEGTFDGLREKLAHYQELGVTAIELLPVADFSGRRNWGYDGVLPFAPDRAYGTPDDLRRLIDAAHGRGLQVFIDVVYNHFGPDGNYLHAYAEDFFDAEKHTPWGAALDFSKREVRDFFIDNAIYWLKEYRFDGIRFDAVHAIEEQGGEDRFLEEMARRIRRDVPGRHVHLVLENDSNEAHLLPHEEDGAPLYDAQWNDDFHHIVHRLITREHDGYYADYSEPSARLLRCLTKGFDYQGEVSGHRGGARRGEPSGHLPPQAFVSFIQNHDQVGNRALGERISEIAPDDAVVAATALYLLSPQIPMLFMGEEWAASTRFPFFCDFEGDLADAVREGRRREFAQFARFSDPKARETIPDPNAQETFLSAKLDWDERAGEPHERRLALFRQLIDIRQTRIVPLLSAGAPEASGARGVGEALRVDYAFPQARLALVANLSASRGAVEGGLPGERLFESHEGLDPGDMPAFSFAAALLAGGPA